MKYYTIVYIDQIMIETYHTSGNSELAQAYLYREYHIFKAKLIHETLFKI